MTTTQKTEEIKVNRIVLPAGLVALKGKTPRYLDNFPRAWAKALFGQYRVDVITNPRDHVTAAQLKDIQAKGLHMEAQALKIKQSAAANMAAEQDDFVVIGWDVPGPGNLTVIVIDWVRTLVDQIKSGQLGAERALRSLGAVAGSFRGAPFKILDLIRSTPVRQHGSINGVPVDRGMLAGLALLGCALSTQRPQDLIKQSPDDDEESIADDPTLSSGWPSLFVPRNDYGQLSQLSDHNVRQFAGHISLKWQDDNRPLLLVLAASATTKVDAIKVDLANGIMHTAHDQLKNTSMGNGTRGAFLSEGKIKSLPGTGSKIEKFANRQKLFLGTGAEVRDRQHSNLKVMTEKGALPVTEGVKIPVLLCNWAMHGSGQIFSHPDTTLDACVTENQKIELTKSEAAMIEGFCAQPGDIIEAGGCVVPNYVNAPEDSPVEIVGVHFTENEYSKDIDVVIVWNRWVENYNGFKLKGMGLKGSVMPLIKKGKHTTDIWTAFPAAKYIVNLEAAKGSALTLAMWAETLPEGLTVDHTDITDEQRATYTEWFKSNTKTMQVRHLIHSALKDYYEAAGHCTEQLEDGLYVVQDIEIIEGTLTAEIEAPLVPHRVTKGSLTMAQAMLIADEF